MVIRVSWIYINLLSGMQLHGVFLVSQIYQFIKWNAPAWCIFSEPDIPIYKVECSCMVYF